MFRLTHRKYSVAVATRNTLDPIDIEKLQFNMINTGLYAWVADPFPYEYNGELYIFAEMMKYNRARGTIGYCKLENGKFTEWKEIIIEPYHLSFPNVFEYNNEIYMCPESGENNNVYLYKCKDFPEIWEKDQEIICDMKLADTIFFEDHNINYGLSCVWTGGVQEHHDLLFKLKDGYQLDEIAKYIPEIKPIWVSRPAGKSFYSRNKQRNILVTQVCEHGYGEGLAFSSFNIEWPRFEGQLVKKVYPSDVSINKKRKYIGMHTYNTTDNFAVIDVVYNGFSPIELAIRGYRKILKLLHVAGQKEK